MIKFTEGASKFHKHISFWGILLLGFLPYLEEHTDLIKAAIPEKYQPLAMVILSLVVAFLRFVKQEKLTNEVRAKHDSGN